MIHHNLHDKIHNGEALMRISKGACYLKETGALDNQQLRQHLDPFG